jgi:hypothetical protein
LAKGSGLVTIDRNPYFRLLGVRSCGGSNTTAVQVQQRSTQNFSTNGYLIGTRGARMISQQQDEREALSLEEDSVHRVYEIIASHFSETRYKVSNLLRKTNMKQPWPLVEKFLKEQPAGSVGLDVGCGNGKYMNINPEIFIIGSDR